jgi:hypothetical protein
LPIHFNHLAVAAKDKHQSATFLTRLLGLPDPTGWGPFLSVTRDDGGRGVYFDDPAGHHFELITQPYGERAPALRSPR